MYDCAVAIISSRESKQILMDTIESVCTASKSSSMLIDVVINGNKSLLDEISRCVPGRYSADLNRPYIRVWFISFRDKANSWNQYVYHIMPKCRFVFFLDGYSCINPDSLEVLARTLSENAHALAATGLPSVGRSAEKLRETISQTPSIAGGLFAMRYETLDEIRFRHVKLPVRIYRVDSFICAILSFSLDPASNQWDSLRIAVCKNASWKDAPLSFYSIRDYVSHWKRLNRQAQGLLENAACRQHLSVERKSPSTFAADKDALIYEFIVKQPSSSLKICLKNPLAIPAVLSALRARSAALPLDPPELICEI